MTFIRDLDALNDGLRGGAVAIGNFDGVHVGHARIAERLLAAARRIERAAVIFTFDPHPAVLLRPGKAPPPLTTTGSKAELLTALGIDAVIAYPTDAALLRLSPEEFFQNIVRGRLSAQTLVEGKSFSFGRGRSGNIDVLGNLAAAAGIPLEVVEPVVVDGEPVSSSRVRRLLTEGDVAAARRLLARPYRVNGHVVRGVGRGASIGFPTANLEGIETLLPREGVYAGRAAATLRGQLRDWPAAINIGPNPTFGESAVKVEVHLIGCQEPLYGATLAVDLLARLRDIQPFDGVESLRAQLARDVAAASAANRN